MSWLQSLFGLSDQTKTVLTDQAHNIAIALATIAATLGFAKGEAIITAVGTLAVGLLSVLSSVSVSSAVSAASNSSNSSTPKS